MCPREYPRGGIQKLGSIRSRVGRVAYAVKGHAHRILRMVRNQTLPFSPSTLSSIPSMDERQTNDYSDDHGRSPTIAVIGDVHDQWEPADGEALQQLGVDLALFVGDFGNESVEVVRAIAHLDLPKAVILGNHDAWYSATDWGRKKCPYDRQVEDRVRQQLDLLSEAHVGYGKLDVPTLGLTVVGGRPFSWGGSEWKTRSFYRDWYGVEDFDQSAKKIVEAVHTAAYDTVIFMGHCGPKGLGDRPEDLCGRDWKPLGGDHGDPDLAVAIAEARALGKQVPLVTFGHMHHRLRHRKDRLRERLGVGSDGTVYLNAASVPRIVELDGERLRNFSLVTLRGNQITRASLVWVDSTSTICHEDMLYEGETLLEKYRSTHPNLADCV